MKKFIKIFSAASLIFILLALLFIFWLALPWPSHEKRDASINIPDRYIVSNEYRFDKQKGNQCSGFSMAYLLNYYGFDLYGEDIYNAMPYKIPKNKYRFSENVIPKGIIKYFKKLNLQAEIHTGSFDDLKFHLFKGKPLIVLIGEGFKWQHYMVLVGFDNQKQEIYFYNPGGTDDLNKLEPGNETLKYVDFLNLWDNKIQIFNKKFYNQIYISID